MYIVYLLMAHDDAIKWKHFPRYWPFVGGIHRSLVPGEFPTQRPLTRSFDIFFGLHLKKRLSKQSWGWWFETLSRPLWRHRNHHVVMFLFQAGEHAAFLRQYSHVETPGPCLVYMNDDEEMKHVIDNPAELTRENFRAMVSKIIDGTIETVPFGD